MAKRLTLIVLMVFLGVGLILPGTIKGEGQAITLSPIKIEVKADPGETISRVLKVRNRSEKQRNLYINLVNFIPEGEEGGSQFLAPEEGEESYSLAHWIGGSNGMSAVFDQSYFDEPYFDEPGGVVSIIAKTIALHVRALTIRLGNRAMTVNLKDRSITLRMEVVTFTKRVLNRAVTVNMRDRSITLGMKAVTLTKRSRNRALTANLRNRSIILRMRAITLTKRAWNRAITLRVKTTRDD